MNSALFNTLAKTIYSDKNMNNMKNAVLKKRNTNNTKMNQKKNKSHPKSYKKCQLSNTAACETSQNASLRSSRNSLSWTFQFGVEVLSNSQLVGTLLLSPLYNT